MQWQFFVDVPFQYRKIGISYHLLDGTPYTPSYAGLHHRNEHLYGIGDPTLEVRYFDSLQNWTFGSAIGTSIPLGRIEEDPYLKAALGEVHQHFQMGTGTFIPSIAGIVMYQKDKNGFLTTLKRDISLYENRLYYRSGSAQTWNIGMWHRFHPKYISLVQLQGRHEQIDTWRDLPAPFSGRDAISCVWSHAFKIRKKQELLLRLERLIFVHNRGDTQVQDGEGFPLYTTYSLGYSFF